MGIPHLITYLTPYAESQSLKGESVVLDGPAFAYHVYYLCMSMKTSARGPFQAVPSYAELSRVALEWLCALEGYGVTIARIYFDGFLPPAKFDTRLSRLVSLTKRMSDHYYANQAVYLPSIKQVDSAITLFNPPSIQPRLTALPPAPFLVPAVLEALKEAIAYKDITYVVPGEADLYCSQYLSTHGGIVLTGDSDLLVHDLGTQGKVGFFKDIYITGSEPKLLKCQSFWPSAISTRLSLPSSHGIIALAFEMTMDSHASFQELTSRAKELKGITAQSALYAEFNKDYQTLTSDPPVSNPGEAISILQSVDPRISEYMLQFPQILALVDHMVDQPPSLGAHVFLPFLVDAPTKTNAWEMSTSIRQLAYGLMNQVVPSSEHRKSVFEHKKQTDKSQGREIILPPLDDISSTCNDLVNLLNDLRTRLGDCSEGDFWISVAVYQDVNFANSQSKRSTTKIVQQQLHNGIIGKTSSWDVVQLFAQIQASYYSFRILKQISSFVLAFSTDSKSPQSLRALCGTLSSLPVLHSLLDLSKMNDILRFIDQSKSFDLSCDLLGLEATTPAVSASKIKKASKKKKKKRDNISTAQGQARSSNPFALLEVE